MDACGAWVLGGVTGFENSSWLLAINSTVYKAEANQVLKVEINGNQEVSVEELVDAGYAVSFSANKSVFTSGTTSTSGELAADLGNTTEFNYSVTVAKGEETFTSSTTGKVTVIDSLATKTIDEVELQTDAGVTQKSNTLTLFNDNFKVVATKGTNVKGDEIKPVNNVKFESSNKSVALIDANGVITPVSAGTSTITVTSGTASKTITVTVADATREITTLKTDVKSVDIVEGVTKNVKVEAFDQFGESIPTGNLTVTSAKDEIATATATASVSPVAVKGISKGSTTVSIKAGDKTITLPVTVGENKADNRKIEVITVADQSDDTTIDVAKDKDKVVTVAYNAYNTAGQLVGPTALKNYDGTPGYSYEVVEKDTSGATADVVDVAYDAGQISLTAKSAGTATINIYDGALKIDSVKVTVNNTTPTVTGATFIKDAKVTTTDATPVLKTSGLNFTSTATDAKFVVNQDNKAGEITNGKSDGDKVVYGTFDFVTNLDGTTATVKDGDLALTVDQSDINAVSGTVSVRIKDITGKVVAVAPIEVEIAQADLVSNSLVGGWVTDRTEPTEFEVADGLITLTTGTQQKDDKFVVNNETRNYNAWHGKQISTDMDVTSDWTVSTSLKIDKEADLNNIGADSSIWLVVYDEEGNRIDYSIFGGRYNIDNDKNIHTGSFQNWDSNAPGNWNNITDTTFELGKEYKLDVKYSSGIVSMYLDGMKVANYDLNSEGGKSRVGEIIINARSFGKEYTSTWGVPVVKSFKK